MLPDTPGVASRLDLIYTITRELNAAGLDIDQVLNRILAAMVATVGASDASLFLFGAEERLENFFLVSGFEVERGSQAAGEVSPDRGLAGWVKAQREGVLITDTRADARWLADNSHPQSGQAGSAVAVPIQLPDQLIGILIITAPEAGHFTQSDLTMLTIIADQAAFAIANARLFKAEQHRRQLADTLASVTQTINSSLNLAEVLDLILEQLARVIDYDSSSIMFYDESGDTLSVRAARGFDDMEDALHFSILIHGGSPNYRAIRQKKPVVIADVDLEPDWLKSSASRDVHSWIGAPLIARDQVIGMLTVDSHEINKYTEENARVVAAFADQAATAVANAQIVTRLQNAESNYTALFEDSTDMIVITTYQGLILDVNRKACLMLRRPKDALIGSDLTFINPHLADHLLQQTGRLKTWRETSLELDVLDAYRQALSLELKARQVHYADKNCVQWVGRDISARKEAEKLRQDLVNMLIHDLRGPLGNLINTIELMSMILDRVEGKHNLSGLLEMALHSGQAVRDLIDSMLDVSRLEAGEVPLQCELVNIQAMIEAVKEQVQPHADGKETSLTFNPLPQIPPLWIDGNMIRRVLINLVDNAIKYTPPKGQVSLTTTLTEDWACFAIADNGPGISKADQPYIFNKFSRVGDTINEQSGVGLGLAFCKLAIEAHGGTISVKSEGIPGRGSTFFVSVPLITAEPKGLK